MEAEALYGLCSAVSRLLGWLNWTSLPCKGVSDWACGGRSHESSDPYVHTTAAEAASDYAAERFIELLDSE
ncbi:hypothetical protein IscW_ISCW001406 [Ixodes scapularis]|uniref:Uncharacterized protein n=1 Tax=Ixodes scapularis TaxID=6945 RepID=B7P133_IXOSC|nr:hypothetical protein IscW_ISCW001406 [Ixodes scapularis]|eukprot:XP_002400144.1 hypothetical protein IscW_ISCW001406 [Ixodes scapularis]